MDKQDEESDVLISNEGFRFILSKEMYEKIKAFEVDYYEYRNQKGFIVKQS